MTSDNFPVTARAARVALPILLFGAALGLMTLHSHSSISAESSAPAGISVGANMRVQIDPATGALVPATDAAFDPRGLSPEAARSHSLQGLQIESRSDGSLHVDLEERFMESVVATTSPTGGTLFDCQPAATAERTVLAAGHAPAPAAAVER